MSTKVCYVRRNISSVILPLSARSGPPCHHGMSYVLDTFGVEEHPSYSDEEVSPDDSQSSSELDSKEESEMTFYQWIGLLAILVLAAGAGIGVGVSLALRTTNDALTLQERMRIVKKILKETPLIDG